MTPEAIRIVSDLRREFYYLFAAAMNVPVKITSNSYSSNFSIAYWLDDQKRMNYVSVYAYTAPDELIPLRPFILRVSINKGADRDSIVKQRQECRGLNRGWHFNLTVLPEEILDFPPWIVNLVKAHDKSSTSWVQPPPHPYGLKVPSIGLFNEAWTEKAWLLVDSQY